MNTLVIGSVTNYTYDKIAPWLNSLRATGYEGKIGLITYNIDAETMKKLESENLALFAFNITPDGAATYNGVQGSIMVDRFMHTAYFLRQVEDIDTVVVTDVRDVIFQSDPSKLELGISDLVLADEGITYGEEPWSKNNMLQSFGPYFFESVKDRNIICAGVIAGDKNTVADLLEQVYLLCRGCPAQIPGGGGPDQAALNILLKSEFHRYGIKISNEILHAGTTKSAVKSGRGDIGFIYVNYPEKRDEIDKVLENAHDAYVKDGLIYNAVSNEPYIIVHQYDRVPAWLETMKKY